MKRYGNIYHKIYDLDNLKLAHKKASKDKKYYKEVKIINKNETFYLMQIQKMLKNKTYKVSQNDYKTFKKKEGGKIRQIFKLDYFPHRIIQHALLLQIENIMLKNFISNTFASLPNRGIHKAHKKLNNDLKKLENGKCFCLQMDVRKFYPSINHEINKLQYRHKFKDKDLLSLIDMLIDSLCLDEQGKEIKNFENIPKENKKGIAIGSLFSQWDGNFYLSKFDHWIKEDKSVKYYYRYCDDLIILSDNKETLHKLRKEIADYLKFNLKLDLKNNYKVYPVEIQGIDFIGYRHFKKYTLLRKSISKRMIKNSRKVYKNYNKNNKISYKEFCSINSYKGWIKWCNSYNLHKKWILPLTKILEEHQGEFKNEKI